METLRLNRDGQLYILELTNGDADNVLNLDVLNDWGKALNEVQAGSEDMALLIHCRHKKTFSTGIDLAWLMKQDQHIAQQFVYELENLLLRIATLNLPTVVAINGNCYAGGALIASACDFRFMREDKGRFCFPEVKIKKAFTPVMMDIVKLLPSLQAAYELALTADAWGGALCAERGVIDQAVAQEELFAVAYDQAKALSVKHRATYTTIKRGMRDRVAALAKERALIG